MTIESLFANKAVKPKEKTETISGWLLDNTLPIDELITFALTQKDTVKATCIEAIEYATKRNSDCANEEVWQFAVDNLKAKAPRIKWESAKVISNIAHLNAASLDKAIAYLLANTENEGTVVRWSAAFALGEILKMNTEHNADLLLAIDAICNKEEKNSIIKIYQNAIKKLSK